MNIYLPYTYHIVWSGHNKHYYGVRYAEGCHPDDFWTSYFTSSQVVQELREQLGEPDIIQIRKTFPDKLSAIEWEHKVLRRLKVMDKDTWLNRHIGKAPFFHESHRENLKKSARNRKYSDSGRSKLSDRSKKLWADPEYKKSQAESISNGMTDESKARIAEFQTGRTRTPEHKKLISEMRKAEWSDEEKSAARKKAISDKIKAKWQDPEYRAKMMARRKKKKS